MTILNQIVRWVINKRSLLLLILVYAGVVVAAPYLSHQETVRSWIKESGLFGIIFIFLILLLVDLAPGISSDIFAVMAGSLFGFAVGFIVTWLAQSIGTLIGYYLVRNSAESFDKARQFGQKIKSSKRFSWLSKIPINSPIFLIAGRWIPGYGGKLVYILAGVYKVPVRRLLWCTAISVLVPAVEFPAIGAGIVNLFGR